MLGSPMIFKSFRNLLLSCTILISGAVGLAHAGALDLNANADTAQTIPASQGVMHDGSFIGNTYDAYYGVVQVQATVRNGQLADVKALKFPNHSGESRYINQQALPMLQQEVVTAQTARVHIISGATLTSRAYIASLRDALLLAGN